ncbi:hypothetical protein VIGAN_05088500, partial [Vigna angularis var. angularis]
LKMTCSFLSKTLHAMVYLLVLMGASMSMLLLSHAMLIYFCFLDCSTYHVMEHHLTAIMYTPSQPPLRNFSSSCHHSESK